MLKRLLRCAALLLALAAPQALAQGKVSVPLLLCPAGCGPTEGDTILMVQMIKEGSPVTLLPQETPGYMYNIREMGQQANWKRFVFSTEDVLIQLAMKWGGTPELKEFLPEKVPVRFKLLYGETWWAQGKFFVTFDPKIQKVADLKGKRISLGLRSQSDWGVFSRIVLAEYGITPQNSDIRHLTPAALTQQLIDGSTDGGTSVFGMEPNRKEWLIGGPLRQLEASEDRFEVGEVTKTDVAQSQSRLSRSTAQRWQHCRWINPVSRPPSPASSRRPPRPRPGVERIRSLAGMVRRRAPGR